jgi:hypothetical protein
MRIFACSLLVVMLFVSLAVFAGDEKANFSGEWVLNEEKSDMGEGGPRWAAGKLTITQKGDTMSVDRSRQRPDGEEFVTTEKLTLDGKECENMVWQSTKKSVATWSDDGKSLTITSTLAFEREGEMMQFDSVEIWKLLDENKALSVDFTSKSPRGERKAVYVYDLKK